MAERTCGKCGHFGLCSSDLPGIVSVGDASDCDYYSELRALPEGIAGLVRAAVHARRLELEWMRPAADLGAAQLEALNEAERARLAATDALSVAELSIAGVEAKEPGPNG